jgi:hypothetical protein
LWTQCGARRTDYNLVADIIRSTITFKDGSPGIQINTFMDGTTQTVASLAGGAGKNIYPGTVAGWQDTALQVKRNI